VNEGVPRKTSRAVNGGGFSTGTNRGVQSGILGYSGSVSATGGTTVTTIGNIKYHQFNASGSFVVNSGGKIEVLIVSGGGSGGSSSWNACPGGGGAGGAQIFQMNVASKETVTVVVGGGGSAPSYLGAASYGNASSVTGTFGIYTLVGGGGGGSAYSSGAGNSPREGIDQGACTAGVGVFGSTLYLGGGGGGGMSNGNGNPGSSGGTLVFGNITFPGGNAGNGGPRFGTGSAGNPGSNTGMYFAPPNSNKGWGSSSGISPYGNGGSPRGMTCCSPGFGNPGSAGAFFLFENTGL